MKFLSQDSLISVSNSCGYIRSRKEHLNTWTEPSCDLINELLSKFCDQIYTLNLSLKKPNYRISSLIEKLMIMIDEMPHKNINHYWAVGGSNLTSILLGGYHPKHDNQNILYCACVSSRVKLYNTSPGIMPSGYLLLGQNRVNHKILKVIL